MTESWSQYVLRICGDVMQKDIAARVGVDPATVNKWIKGHRPHGDQVVAFARAYDRSPIEAFIAASYINPDEVDSVVEVETSLQDVSDKELLRELTGRLARLRQLLNVGDDTKDGLVAGDWSEDPGVGGMENSN
jgi:transcriptional regulator with XRE-family HTH domain